MHEKKLGKPRHQITVRPEFFNHNTTTLAPEGYMYSEVFNNQFGSHTIAQKHSVGAGAGSR